MFLNQDVSHSSVESTLALALLIYHGTEAAIVPKFFSFSFSFLSEEKGEGQGKWKEEQEKEEEEEGSGGWRRGGRREGSGGY